uniref:hypothetical protein n=1 Tax=Planotetraspora phitsanulokensis TaxID=575192 RepID=UPI003571007E
MPQSVEAVAAQFRSRLAGRRVLVVLDNARDSDQVRPLLPGTPGCLVIITSRHQLHSLVALEGARLLTLDVWPQAEAREALARRLGDERVAAEPDAVAEIIALCGGLPLALAIVAARAAVARGTSLVALAAELREAHGTLDAFSDTDLSVDARAVFNWSYRTLAPDSARLLRLLSLHPAPHITLTAWRRCRCGVSVRSWPTSSARISSPNTGTTGTACTTCCAPSPPKRSSSPANRPWRCSAWSSTTCTPYAIPTSRTGSRRSTPRILRERTSSWTPSTGFPPPVDGICVSERCWPPSSARRRAVTWTARRRRPPWIGRRRGSPTTGRQDSYPAHSRLSARPPAPRIRS